MHWSISNKFRAYIRTLYRPPFVGKHGDAFQHTYLCGLPPHKPATTRPRRGRIWKIPPCQYHKRIRSFIPHHLVRSAHFHCIFPQNLLQILRYGMIRHTTQTPRDDPVYCPRHQRHCIGVELAATGFPPTHGSLTYAETCETRPCYTLWRLAPPDTSPSFERKPALPAGAMVHAISIQQ